MDLHIKKYPAKMPNKNILKGYEKASPSHPFILPIKNEQRMKKE